MHIERKNKNNIWTQKKIYCFQMSREKDVVDGGDDKSAARKIYVLMGN